MSGMKLVVLAIVAMVMHVNGQCTITNGIDYKSPGNNANEGQLTTIYGIPSAAACCASCATFEECKYFSWSTAGDNTCYLKTSVVVPYSNSKFQGGVSPQQVPNHLSAPCSTPVVGTDYDNGYLGATLYSVPNVAACCQACKNYTGCNYYGYASGNSACYLKGSDASPVSNSGVTSGTIVTPPPSNVTPRQGKRGLGVFNTVSCSDISLLSSVSWAYNWAPQVQNELKQCYIDLGIEYVPMQWGLPLALQNIDTSAKWLLGFNEPNFASQSNISPAAAAQAWPQIQAFAQQHGMKLVSPAAAAGGQPDAVVWLDEFFGNCTGCQVDAVATHIYSCYPGGVKGYTDQMKKYNKPIWLTEFSCAGYQYGANGVGITDWAGMAQYTNNTLNLLEGDAAYMRYAFFGTGRGPNEGVGKWSNVFNQSVSALSAVGVQYVNHPLNLSATWGTSSSSSSTSSSSSSPSSSATSSTSASPSSAPSSATSSTSASPSSAPSSASATASTSGVSVSTTGVSPTRYPIYIGCYIDGQTGRDLPNQQTSSSPMTVQICEALCVAAKKAYAGLQYARECWCGNSYGNQGGQVNSSQCNMPCVGNTTQMCGAGNRNSIYQVMDVASAAQSEALPSSSSSLASLLFSCSLLVVLFAHLF